MDKKQSRNRRKKKTRYIISGLNAVRLCVHRTPQHIYAQLIDSSSSVLAAGSSLESDIRANVKHTGNVEAAKLVGKLIAERAKEKGVSKVAFDRSGSVSYTHLRAHET